MGNEANWAKNEEKKRIHNLKTGMHALMILIEVNASQGLCVCVCVYMFGNVIFGCNTQYPYSDPYSLGNVGV